MARPISSHITRVGSPDKPLNEQEFNYVKHRAQGLPKSASARIAGYAHPKDVCGDLEKRPHVKQALMLEAEAYAKAADVSRQEVVDGIRAAIEQAVLMADPTAQIAGWRELAKICGFYAPEIKQIQLSTDAQKIQHRFEQLSDAELLQLATGEVIEGDFAKVN